MPHDNSAAPGPRAARPPFAASAVRKNRSAGRSAPQRTARIGLLIAGVAMLAPLVALAHFVTPDEVIQSLINTGTRQKFDITAAERSADQPSLLIIRVGPGWAGVYAARRVVAAEEWYQLWRDAVPDGALEIVDAAERPVVTFDADGRATLRDAAPAPSAGTPTH